MFLILVFMISKVTHDSSKCSHISAFEGQPHKFTTSQASHPWISEYLNICQPCNPPTSQVTALNIMFRQMLMAALFSLPPGLMMEVRLLPSHPVFVLVFDDGKSSNSILSSHPASLLLTPILIFSSPCLPISSSSSFTAFPPLWSS